MAALGKPLQSRGPRPPAASFLEAFGEALAKLVPAVVLLLQRGANWLPRPLVVWRDTHSEPHRASVQKYGPGLVRLAVDCEGAWGIPQRVWRELDVPPDSLRSALPSLELTLTDGELTAELAAWLAGAITHGVTQAPPLEMEPNFFDPETRQLYSYFWTAAASAEHQRRR